MSEAVVARREAELAAARDGLGLFKAPLTTVALFTESMQSFLMTTAKDVATSRLAVMFCYPLLAAIVLAKHTSPAWFAPPSCNGEHGGHLYLPAALAYEAAWWVGLGILSSIGFGTGLHSGIMFLWPFVMSVILSAEGCQSTNINALYNHPCSLKCGGADAPDGSLTFFKTFLLLAPAVFLWGSGTAIGELPPYFITRAARRSGTRATDFEAELAEAREKGDLVSKLKVWTIAFTEKHGFLGVLLLASWPNAAFDMCGMACGWLEMPFETFFGATLIGKGFVKVSLQTLGCIVLFGPATWTALLSIMPRLAIPAAACAAADVTSETCNLVSFMTAGRDKAMHSFEMQRRLLPQELLGHGQTKMDINTLTERFCAVRLICGDKHYGSGSFPNQAKYAEMAAAAARTMHAYDIDGDSRLSLKELGAAVSASDGKLSLASIDPGAGGVLSAGVIWNGFIAALVIFFMCSIVEQVAISMQASRDAKELELLQARATSSGRKGNGLKRH